MTRTVHIRSNQNLSDTARAIFKMLSIPRIEVRDSDNYPGGEYYRGIAGDLQIRISHEDPDDAAFEDCQFVLALQTGPGAKYPMDDTLRALIRELLAAGYFVARESSHTESTVERTIYTIGPGAELLESSEARPLA